MKTPYLVIIMALVFSVGLTLGSKKGENATPAEIQSVAPALSSETVISNAASFQMETNSKSLTSDSDYALVNFPGHTDYYAVYLPR